MTDRAEIERLLNMTGRTLEGLSKSYDFKETYNAYYHTSSSSPGQMLCHQSDVIELLVGALRDALEKPMQKPMTFSEVRRSGDAVPCWVEEKYVIYPDVLRKKNDTYYGQIQLIEGVLPRSCYLLEADQYGKTWRCWATRPTIEEREAAKWEN